jgi:hypothetical protein
MDKDIWLFAFGAFQAVGALLVILQFFGITPRVLNGVTNMIKKRWAVVAIALIVGSFCFSIYGMYLVHGQESRRGVRKDQWAAFVKEEVRDRAFKNERVVLDGHRFVHCNFEHVTLVFNGTAPFDLIENSITMPVVLNSEDPAINGAWLALEEFRRLEQEFKAKQKSP